MGTFLHGIKTCPSENEADLCQPEKKKATEVSGRCVDVTQMSVRMQPDAETKEELPWLAQDEPRSESVCIGRSPGHAAGLLQCSHRNPRGVISMTVTGWGGVAVACGTSPKKCWGNTILFWLS